MDKLRLVLVGGGPGSFIGPVYRMAAELDGEIALVAGAFSSDPARSRKAGRRYGVDPSRAHASLEGGAVGVLTASQISAGERNGLRVRVYGEAGGLDWSHERPNELVVNWLDRGSETLHAGSAYLSAAAKGATRLPSGHPEGFIEAFANIYRLLGASLVMAAMFLTVHPLIQGREAGWTVWTSAMFVASAGFAAAFVLHIRRRGEAALPPPRCSATTSIAAGCWWSWRCRRR